MDKRLKQLVFSCVIAVTLICVITQAKDIFGKEITDTASISARAAELKDLYKAKYPEQEEVIDDIVNILSNSDEFISIYEAEGASAFCIIEESLRDALEPAATLCGYTAERYFSDYGSPLIKQTDGKSCGPAAALMALIGSGAPGYHDTNDEATLAAWQENLKDQLQTTADGIGIGRITSLLQKSVPSRNDCQFQSKAFTKYSCHLALGYIEESLINDAVPILLIKDTSLLDYYNGHACSHYMAVVSVDTLEGKITLADPNDNDLYFGYHDISFDEFHNLAENTKVLWMSIYMNPVRDEIGTLESSPGSSAEATPAPQAGEVNPSGGAEKPDAGTKRAVYGEVEIPDVPCGTADSEGRADIEWEADSEKQKLCLESMVFETHTMGDYTVSLVGDLVRTDEANFPGSIYVRKLRVEAEKNGVKIQGYGGYSDLILYVRQQREYRLFSEKLGSYLDLYDLEYPVIAMRYYFEESPARLVTRAVDFAVIQEDELYSDFVGECETGTGVGLNQKGGSSDETILSINDHDTRCRVSVFAGEEFKILDQNTLVDEEAGIRYIFEFSNPPQMVHYKAEKIKKADTEANPPGGAEKPDAETKRAVYGEAEIPDIPCGTGPEGTAGIVWQFDPEKQKLCLESMVFETHTMGDYTFSLVGDLVRTDEANFPGSIYARKLRVKAEKNGIKIQGFGGYSGLLLYAGQQMEYRLFSEKLGSYFELYDLEYPVVAMRYYYEESLTRLVTKAVDFAYIREGKFYDNFVGECEAGTGVDLNQEGSSSDGTALRINDEDTLCRVSIFAGEEFQIVDQKTLVDEEAGIRYIFQFSDPSQMSLYRAEKIKKADTETNPSGGTEKADIETKRAVYGETEIPDVPCEEAGAEGRAGVVWQSDLEKQKLCLESMVFETRTMGDYTFSLVGDLVRMDEANFPGSIYTQNLRVEAEKNGIKIQGQGGYRGLLLYAGQQWEYRLFSEKIGSYFELYDLEYPVIALRYYYEESPARLVTKAVIFAYIREDEIFDDFMGECEAGTGIGLNPNPGESSSYETVLSVNDKDTLCQANVFTGEEFKILDQKTLVDEEAGIRYSFQFSNPPQMVLYKAEKIK